MFLGLFDCKFHPIMGNHLADVVIPIDEGCGLPFTDDLVPFIEIDQSGLDPRHVGEDTGDTVSWISLEVGLNKQLCHKVRILLWYPSGREQLLTELKQFAVVEFCQLFLLKAEKV